LRIGREAKKIFNYISIIYIYAALILPENRQMNEDERHSQEPFMFTHL